MDAVAGHGGACALLSGVADGLPEGVSAGQAAAQEGAARLSRLSGRDDRVLRPDDRRASKVAVGILLGAGEEVAELRRWTLAAGDVRDDDALAAAILEFIAPFDVRTVAMTDRIIGCPHEEGVDYEGPTCPSCPFWTHRDRWTGEILQ